MSDAFRNKTEVQDIKEPVIESKPAALTDVTNVEVPYLDAPDFLDQYFGIGEEWKDHDATMYPEVKAIDSYITDKIRSGELVNSQQAIKDFLKGIEKLTDLRNERRSVVKLEVIANYIEFLSKNDNLKSNLKRYAN